MAVGRCREGKLPMQQSVLIVDGDPASLDQLCTYVAECDFRIQTATTLSSALTRLSENRFTIVIVDWQLADNEALDLVSNIRSNHRLRRTHIIALSEPADSETVQNVLKAGVDDFFARPVSATEVRTRLLWAKSRSLELV